MRQLCPLIHRFGPLMRMLFDPIQMLLLIKHAQIDRRFRAVPFDVKLFHGFAIAELEFPPTSS